MVVVSCGCFEADHRAGDGVRRGLGRLYGEGRFARYQPSEFVDGRVELIDGDDPIEESGAEGFGRVEGSARHDEFLGSGRADLADKTMKAAPGEGNAEVDLGNGELGIVGCNPQVARGREHKAPSDAVTVDRGNSHGLHSLDRVTHLPPGSGGVDRVVSVWAEGIEVHAAAETRSETSDDDHANVLVVVDQTGGRRQGQKRLGRQRVSPVGPVEQEVGTGPVDGELQSFVVLDHVLTVPG